MKLRFLLALPLLLAAFDDSKYPYPPQFVGPKQYSPATLGAPPPQDSPQFAAEIESIIAKQAKLTEKDIAAIKHEITIRPEVMVEGVLGKNYTPKKYPALYMLLKHAASDAWRLSDITREYWKSPRPWYADSRVKLHTEEITTPGYPSGHTTTFGTWACVLSELMPEKREAFYTKAWTVGGNRMLGGAHFPFDVDGGKRLAAIICASMKSSPAFVKEFNKAALELKRPGVMKTASTRVPDAPKVKQRPPASLPQPVIAPAPSLNP